MNRADDLTGAGPAPIRITPTAPEAGAGRDDPDRVGEPASGREASVLEARYRGLLRMLPRAYRDIREEEMVGTFLTARCDEDPENYDLTLKHGRPGGAEIRAVAALAVRARWGEAVAPERFAAREIAWRMVLLTGVTIMWAFTVAQLIGIGVALAVDPAPVGSPAAAEIYRTALSLEPGSWVWWSTWAYLGWAVTLPLLVFGGRTGARWAAACAAVPVGVEAIRWARNSVPLSSAISRAMDLLVSLALLGLLAALAVRPDSGGSAQSTAGAAGPQGARPRRFLLAGCGMVAVLIACTAVAWFEPELWTSSSPGAALFRSAGWLVSFDAGWWTLAAAIWGISMLVDRRHCADPVRAAGRATGCAGVAGIATVLSAAWALEFARTDVGTDAFGWTLTVTNAVQMAVAGGVFVISAVVAAWRVRALPRGKYAAAHRIADAEH